jgi:hypothetical protein
MGNRGQEFRHCLLCFSCTLPPYVVAYKKGGGSFFPLTFPTLPKELVYYGNQGRISFKKALVLGLKKKFAKNNSCNHKSENENIYLKEEHQS